LEIVGEEEKVARKLRKEMQSLKQRTDVIKVGFILPERSGDEEIKRELEWWEEEMNHRETLRAKNTEIEELYNSRLNEVKMKEARLEELKILWQAKNDQIKLEEEELVSLQTEFEEKIQLHLNTLSEQQAPKDEATHRSSRMKEEAERRTLKKALKQDAGGVDTELRARNQILRDVEERAILEREILRLRREAGLMRQRLHGQEKSHMQVMNEEKRRRDEKYSAAPIELPPLEELYAPKKVPPKPVILRAHETRMLEAQQAKAARLAARQNTTNSATTTPVTTTVNNHDIGSSSSSSGSSSKSKGTH